MNKVIALKNFLLSNKILHYTGVLEYEPFITSGNGIRISWGVPVYVQNRRLSTNTDKKDKKSI